MPKLSDSDVEAMRQAAMTNYWNCEHYKRLSEEMLAVLKLYFTTDVDVLKFADAAMAVINKAEGKDPGN